ncbi:hypothetical protein KY312_04540, partial [Candidatus Woesearchaeota archaeon]|nr:hypothetical protein [Candidatus Woesearchaeota archaeon]
MMYLIPIFTLFVFGGIESTFELMGTSFYYALGSAGLILVFGLGLRELLKKKKEQFGEVIIHNPEKSLFAKVKILAWTTKPVKLALFSLIFFSILVTFGALNQQTGLPLTGIPLLVEQQFTPTGQFLSAIEPACSAETLFLLALIGILVSIIRHLQYKYKYSDTFYWIVGLTAIPIFSGLFGVALHTARYAASEVSLLGVFFYWFFTGLLIVMFASVIPAIIWHYANNAILKFQEMTSNEMLFVAVFAAITLAIIIFILLFIARKRGGNGG